MIRSSSECRSRRWTAVALLAASWLAGGCRQPAAPTRGPIVLVTASSFRADAAEAIPARLLGPEAWRGTAVAASSEPVVSFASLATGVGPWQHQVLGPGGRPRVQALPEVLAAAGYRSRSHLPERLREVLGESIETIDPSSEAGLELSDGDFLWFHFSEAELMQRRWKRNWRHPFRLLVWADPDVPLPPAERKALWRTYRGGVRRLCEEIGRLVDLLRESPAWPRTTVVITGTDGLELGEHGQILQGENLGRETIEVPLLVRLGEGAGQLAEPFGARVAQRRIWTTLVEIAGLEASPVHSPSLFHVTEPVMLSELYSRNGVNRFSLLSGDLQLHWSTRFAPAEAEYYLARRAEAGARPRHLSEPPGRILRRLDEAFRRTLPLSGLPGREPELHLERWTAEGVEAVEDPAETRRLGTLLRRRWSRFVDWERSPAEERHTPRG